MKKVAVCYPTPECASFAVNLVTNLAAEGTVDGEFAFQSPTQNSLITDGSSTFQICFPHPFVITAGSNHEFAVQKRFQARR